MIDLKGDRKYGLLRALQFGSAGTLLVAWMLTPDDGGPDGKFRSYLQQPERWRGFDPELFDGLVNAAQMTSVPHVSLIERSGLLPCTAFYSAIVPDGREERSAWREGLKSGYGTLLLRLMRVAVRT